MGDHNLAKFWVTLRGTLSEKDAVSLVFKVFGVCPPEWGRPFFRPILELKSIKRGVASPYVEMRGRSRGSTGGGVGVTLLGHRGCPFCNPPFRTPP